MRINKLLTNYGYTLTEEEKACLKVTLEDVIGEIQSEEGYWRPFVNGTNGNLYWEWDTSPTGNTPAQRKILYWPSFSADPENSHLLWKLDNDESWTDLNITTSGAKGPQGDPGEKGTDGTSVHLDDVSTVVGGTQVTLGWGTSDTSAFVIPSGAAGTNGEDGFSPTVTTSAIQSTSSHPQGGTSVTITDKTGANQFYVWNGINGEGTTVNLLEGTGIHIDQNGTNYTIGVSADYALKSELPDLTDYATKTYANDASAYALSQAESWVGQQGYLKAVPDSYATKTYANDASANALSEAETWVGQQNFATSAGLVADKQYAMTTNGWADFVIPSTSGYLPLSGGTVSGKTIISGTEFDTFELKRSDQQGSTGIVGINGAGGMSLKIVNGNNNTQLNIAPNATMDKRFSIGDSPYSPSAYFIPAVTATTTAGLTDDGILHIILESN